MWYWELGKVDFDLLNAIKDSNDGHVALMQYTGLKDKNGVEIYEGDILQGDNNDFVIKKEKHVIEWDEETTGFSPFIYDLNDTGGWIDRESMEVIGNIYENAEILAGK